MRTLLAVFFVSKDGHGLNGVFVEKLDTWGKEMRKLVMNGEKFTVKPFKVRKHFVNGFSSYLKSKRYIIK